MDRHIKILFTAVCVLLACCFLQGCSSSPEKANKRCEPLLVADEPQYDESTNTFSLTVRVDSTEDADITYYLYDGDSLLMENSDGYFSAIAPLEEGYNVQAKVVWSDTTVVIPAVKVMGFIILKKIEKLPEKELQNLINKMDSNALEAHMAQQVKLTVLDSKIKPSLIHAVLLQIKNKVWDSVTVTEVEYNDNNYIVAITLKPVEHIVPVSEDDEEIIVDEY